MAPKNEHSISVKVSLDASGAQAYGAVNNLASQGQGATLKTARTLKDPAGNVIGVREDAVRAATNDEILNRVEADRARRIRMNLPVNPNSQALAHLGVGDNLSATSAAAAEEAGTDRELAGSLIARTYSKKARGVATREGTIYKYEQLLARNPNLSSASGLAGAIARLAKARNNADTDPGEWAQAQLAANKAASPFRDELRATTPADRVRLAQAGVAHRGRDLSIQELKAYNAAGAIDPKTGKPGAARNDPTIAAAIAQAEVLQNANAGLIKPGATQEDLKSASENAALLKEQLANANRQKKINDTEENNAKKEGKLLDWMSERGGRLSGAMVVRSGIGRVTQFGQHIMGAEGDALAPTLGIGIAKTGTGIGTDLFMNRFITQEKGKVGNFIGMAGFGIADAILGAIQTAIARGTNLKREATATAMSQEGSLSRTLAASGTFSDINSRMASKWTAADQQAANYHREFDRIGAEFGGPGTLGAMITNFGRQGVGGNPGDLRQRSGDVQRAAMRMMRYQASMNASRDWNDSFQNDEAYKGMSLLASSGADPRLMAMAGYGRKKRGLNFLGLGNTGNYNQGIDELGLGAGIAGIAANTNMKAQSAAALFGVDYLGIGSNGISGANHLAGLTQNGLPGPVADQLAAAIAAAGANGMNTDVNKTANYANSLVSSGMSKGRIGTAMAATMGGRTQARATIGGGFKGMLGNAALLSALSQTGDISSAMDMVSNMSDYDQVQAMQRYFGSDISKMSLQAEGLSGDDATRMLGAGPSGTTAFDISTGSEAAHTGNRLSNSRQRDLMAAAYSVTTEERSREIQKVLESAAISLNTAAGLMGGMASAPE